MRQACARDSILPKVSNVTAKSAESQPSVINYNEGVAEEKERRIVELRERISKNAAKRQKIVAFLDQENAEILNDKNVALKKKC